MLFSPPLPNFSTKERQISTGLGLAVVRAIARAHALAGIDVSQP